MKHFTLFVFIASLYLNSKAQELYVFTNPASNIPAKAVVVKAASKTMRSYHNNEREFRLIPEVQVGLNKNLMLTGGVTFSNMFFQTGQRFESARLYAKYRFFSRDEVHQHFRMAVFTAGSWSKNPLVYQELNLEGDNTGIQLGMIGTQLVNKLAISGGISYLKQIAQTEKVNFGLPFSSNTFQYNISMGYLLFPRTYSSYKQTNLNLYCELLGQQNVDIKRGFFDVAPSIQFIVKSSTRLNLGSRFQLAGSAHRMANQSFFFSLEHYFLNVIN